MVFPNDAGGHRRLIAALSDHGVRSVGVEASGGYERTLVAALRAKGVTVVVFQPVQVRAYGAFLGLRAKTDPIDARLIARCTRLAGERHRIPPDPRLAEFAEHLTLIEQIEEDLVRAKTRLEGFTRPDLKRKVEAVITRLTARRALEIAALVRRIRAHGTLAARLALIGSVDGVGERTALALLIRMPELGTLSREQAAALAGLAPFDRQSGAKDRQRSIQGGRARLRRSLFAAALPAAFRWNQALVALYKRLTAKGAPHKKALVACARKLLIFVNAVVARGAPWNTQNAAAT
jgi:transposase